MQFGKSTFELAIPIGSFLSLVKSARELRPNSGSSQKVTEHLVIGVID